jgi:hypothetical protein
LVRFQSGFDTLGGIRPGRPFHYTCPAARLKLRDS